MECSPVVVPAARNLDRVAEQSAGPVDVRSRVELLNRLRRLVRANAIDGRPPSEVEPQDVRYAQRRIVRARDRADSIEFPARKFPSRQSRSAESSEAFSARRTLRRASRQRTSTCPRASEAAIATADDSRPKNCAEGWNRPGGRGSTSLLASACASTPVLFGRRCERREAREIAPHEIGHDLASGRESSLIGPGSRAEPTTTTTPPERLPLFFSI
jgi:hypothetical protein